MNLYGKRFIYDGVASSAYGLVISSVSSEVNNTVIGEMSDNTFYGKKDMRKYLLGTSWESTPLSFEVELVREKPFENIDLRAAERWLFKNTDYKKLYIDPEDDFDDETTEIVEGEEKRLYLNCRLINPTKLMMSGGVVGFTCTIDCDSAFAHQDAITKTLTPEDATNGELFTVDAVFDCPGYIYPRVAITTGSSGGDIVIANNTDDSSRLTKFVDMPAHHQFAMNGAINYISGNNYIRFDGGNFLRLIDGRNAISVTGDVETVSLTWSNMRYM